MLELLTDLQVKERRGKLLVDDTYVLTEPMVKASISGML